MSPTGSLAALLLAVASARAEEPASLPAPADNSPAEPAPAEEPDADERPDAAAPIVRGGSRKLAPPVPRVSLGARLGAALPLVGLGPGVAPGLEAGVVIDDGGRFTVVIGGDYADNAGAGTAGPETAPYEWTLAMRTLTVHAALRWRVLPWTESLSPELSAGPTLGAWEGEAGGTWNGAALPVTREARVGGGGFVAAGLAGRVGPGTLEGRVTFGLSAIRGALPGETILPALTPAIGYRLER